jgi:hypothetical protein
MDAVAGGGAGEGDVARGVCGSKWTWLPAGIRLNIDQRWVRGEIVQGKLTKGGGGVDGCRAV